MTQQEQVMQAIKDLHHTQTQQMNHLLALQVFCHSLIPLLNLDQTRQVLDLYQHGLDGLAAQIHPTWQRPAKWEDLRLSLQNRLQALQPHTG